MNHIRLRLPAAMAFVALAAPVLAAPVLAATSRSFATGGQLR